MLSNIKFEGVTPMRRLIEKFPEVAKVKKRERGLFFWSFSFLGAYLVHCVCEKEKIQEILLEELICSGAKGMSGIIIMNQIICYLA